MIPGAPVERTQQKFLRNSTSILLQRPVTHTNAHLHSFFPDTIALWNNLAPSVQTSEILFILSNVLYVFSITIVIFFPP